MPRCDRFHFFFFYGGYGGRWVVYLRLGCCRESPRLTPQHPNTPSLPCSQPIEVFGASGEGGQYVLALDGGGGAFGSGSNGVSAAQQGSSGFSAAAAGIAAAADEGGDGIDPTTPRAAISYDDVDTEVAGVETSGRPQDFLLKGPRGTIYVNPEQRVRPAGRQRPGIFVSSSFPPLIDCPPPRPMT